MLTNDYKNQYQKLVKLLDKKFEELSADKSVHPKSYFMMDKPLITEEGIKARYYSFQDP